MPTGNELEAILDAVLTRAEQLRRVGVARLVVLDVVEVELAPPPAVGGGRSVDKSLSDPLSDPATYSGGYVPGFPGAGRREFPGDDEP